MVCRRAAIVHLSSGGSQSSDEHRSTLLRHLDVVNQTDSTIDDKVAMQVLQARHERRTTTLGRSSPGTLTQWSQMVFLAMKRRWRARTPTMMLASMFDF